MVSVADTDGMSRTPASSPEFGDLERRRLRVLVAGDVEAAAAMHADDYQLINAGGGVVTKQAYLDWIASGEVHYRVFEAASEVEVKSFDDVAMVRYRARIESDFFGGQDSGTFWHTDIYERRDGQWLAVWSQATRIRE
jgi:hypothetical protein